MMSLTIFFIFFTTLTSSAIAAFIEFENCLSPNTINSSPRRLQFVPLFFDAKFNRTHPSHNLNVTIFGNVTGQAREGEYPPPDDPSWDNPNSTFGKILDISPTNNKFSTLFSRFNVLSYTPYRAEPSSFCQSTVNQDCPLGPAFDGNESDPDTLPGFTVAHDFYSPYAFSTLAATIYVKSGDKGAPDLACVSAGITPALGDKISNAIRLTPAAILVLVALATITAAIFSPWGTSDIYRWSSNYGRDEDLLRLVTPGLGDCLQYIQFAFLLGSLTLNYPGFFQPVLSKLSWSVLLFNESFVSDSDGFDSLVDGVYAIDGDYGLTRMIQLIGLAEDEDLWAGHVIWLLVIIGSVVLLSQAGYLFRWGYRYILNQQEQDLQSKNMPFTVGNIIRITYNYFLLPLISFSMFQLLVAGRSRTVVVALAAIFLIGLFGVSGWILRNIFTTKPLSHLFDDLPTVLLYGPLYNTYSDDAAPYAANHILLAVFRGVAVGAVQPSGIAQLVLLAICEVIFILTLHAFRPFSSPTSMNAYHTIFAFARLATTLLSVAFVPSLGVTEDARGWIGYVILLLHGMILIFGFFLNAIQTIIEVLARAAGAGGESRGPLVRAFGSRQLSRRARRNMRGSLNSDIPIFPDDSDVKSLPGPDGRSRSLSASSAILLNQNSPLALDQSSQGGDYSNFSGSVSPRGPSALSFTGLGATSRKSTFGLKPGEAVDPYYRPPRIKRPDPDATAPGARSRMSWANGDLYNRPYQDDPENPDIAGKDHSSLSSPERDAPSRAYIRTNRDDPDMNMNDKDGPRPDYAVREVDLYYGVQRGPALSNLPTRRLKTGPADPTGPVASAASWLKGVFVGKSKDKGKGFEVVRSRRAPPQMVLAEQGKTSPPINPEPYKDSPKQLDEVMKQIPEDDFGVRKITGQGPAKTAPLRVSEHQFEGSNFGDGGSPGGDFDDHARSTVQPPFGQITGLPPSRPLAETGEGIELPSRNGSKVSGIARLAPQFQSQESIVPDIPRKSSKRISTEQGMLLGHVPRLSMVEDSPYSPQDDSFRDSFQNANQDRNSVGVASNHLQVLHPSTSSRLPFESASGKEGSHSPDRLSGDRSCESGTSSFTRNGGHTRNRSSGGGVGGVNDASKHHFRGGSTDYGVVADSKDVFGQYDGDEEDVSSPARRGGHGLSPSDVPERPLSTGYVTHHLASESIRPSKYGQNSFLGTSAEVVDAEGRRKSTSTGKTGDVPQSGSL